MRILIAENDFTSRNVLAAAVKKCGHEVVETANGLEAWEMMQQPNAPRLAILEWSMPEMGGIEVCQRIRQMETGQPPYVIMLTSLDDKEQLREGLDAGVDEFLGKPFDSAELRARLGVAERVIQLQDELAQAAHLDALTQLPNRESILLALGHELSRAPREGQIVGVAVLDIDHFKQIGDTYGRAAGDEVLRALAKRCQEVLRPYDAIGRFGGEEFLVVAPNCAPDEGPWERLRIAIAASPFPTQSGNITVTISIGVAYDDGTLGAHKVIASAVQALGRAKEEGRNRVETDSYALGFPPATSKAPTASAISGSAPANRLFSGTAAAPGPLREKPRVLIADDSFVSRSVLAAILGKQGYEVTETTNGTEALAAMQQPGAPRLAILDWMMPEMDGVEVCRRLRAAVTDQPPYLIILTALAGKKHLCHGLEAGANDYLGKPFDSEELRARVEVGFQMLDLQAQLANKVRDLQAALDEVKTLKGIIPICAKCKKIRNDKGYWEQVEVFVRHHSEAEFSHGICPECMRAMYPGVFDNEP